MLVGMAGAHAGCGIDGLDDRSGICDGVHIMATGAEKNVPSILEKAGVTVEA